MSMKSINSIDRKIQDTIDEIEKMSDKTSLVMRIMNTELQRRLEELKKERQEIINSSNRDCVSIRVYGEKIEKGRISNRLLISILSGFQLMTEGIANTITGSGATKGKITDLAKSLTDFEVSGFYDGSFGVVMEKRHEQLEIQSDFSKTNQIMSEFFNILENSRLGIDLIESISPYGIRTVNYYKQWLNSIRENSINVEIDWKDDSAEIRKIDIKYYGVEDTIFTLDSIGEIEEESVIIKGILTGVNIRKNTFEVNSEENGIIRGKSTLETLLAISDKIGHEINTSMIKNVSISQNNILKTTWFLSNLC